MTDKKWAAVWGGWVAYFVVAEHLAIKSENGKAPLSYFLRHALGVPHSSWHRRAGQVVAGGAFVWLVQHLAERTIDG